MRIALIDADIVAFRAAAGSGEQDIDWGDGLEGKTIDPAGACRTAEHLVTTWTTKADCAMPLLCFSPREGKTFRHAVWPGYKPGRGDKPETYWTVVDHLERAFKWRRIQSLEADDVMGILSGHPDMDNPVIVSADKDMQTIPGRLLNPLKDTRVRTIKVAQANLFWMYQTLAGDPTDGYKGCPGIGEVKARAALASSDGSLPGLWRAVVDLFANRRFTPEQAIQQARLARILRYGDYDPTHERITLWHPTSPPNYLSLDPASWPSTPPPRAVGSQRSPRSSRRPATPA